ncbi:MAG TPA: hypothetical protein VM434_11770 [Beijerinckiaceae bacterium]|nr:hypothetical protein [Beijerinckiaceae bacterium]
MTDFSEAARRVLGHSPRAATARRALIAARAAQHPATDPLPDPTFGEIATELYLAANREAIGLEALEHEQAHRPDRVKAQTIAEVRRTAQVIAAAHALMMALVPHEAAVRALADAPLVDHRPAPAEGA